MKQNEYKVVLTNGTVKHEYKKIADCEREAIILAQAEAIQMARGYDFVSCVRIDKPDMYMDFGFIEGILPIKILNNINGIIEIKILK
jgi:hypothetical protein